MVFMGRIGEFLLIMHLECVKYLMMFKYKVFVKLLLVTRYHVLALRNVNNRLQATLFYRAIFFTLSKKVQCNSYKGFLWKFCTMQSFWILRILFFDCRILVETYVLAIAKIFLFKLN
jgi:hypothetical protein